ncbi:hypothetical protein [Streptococcus respiraculi]|uniref:hypothetical protein n=1 Tax=Streptococcus respiraculi TaxID=2021971 RepID=UPI000E749CD1|nr:hypothetical protein [Streptococcus respiraculi]
MKKSYPWQILLILLALYLILIAFFPELNFIFHYIRFTLFLALFCLWIGGERRNAILFFIGLGFSSLYLRDVIPYSYTTFNVIPLFFGLLILGIAVHSILRKRNTQKIVQFTASNTSSVVSNDANYIAITANFTDKYEYSTAPALKTGSIKAFCSNVQLDLSGAKFEKETIYFTLTNTLSNCHIRIPRHVKVVNTLKSGFGEIYLPPVPDNTSHQIYLVGNNTAGSITIQYMD